MFFTSLEKEKEYIDYNETIKQKHKDCLDLKCSSGNSIRSKINRLKKNGIIKTIENRIDYLTDERKKDLKILDSRYKLLETAKNDRSNTNYFFDKRIAVYTCVTGKYDTLIEPHIRPDNIDYYAFTDFDIPENSIWQRIDINRIENVKDLSNVLKNRYIKMNPHKIFNNYEYSIYVDGNIEIYTDFTEHINRMSKYGLSLFKHSHRKSSYEEADACKLLRKADDESIDNYVNKLKKEGFPDNYGLLQCSIIARKHSEKLCQKISEEWWSEFRDNVKRDQIILPYILFKNSIGIDDVATLGGNIDKDLSFETIKHERN